MSNYGLAITLILLALFAISVMLYPLRQQRILMIGLASVLFSLSGIAYWHWGSWQALLQHHQQSVQQKRIRDVLASVKGPQEIVDRLTQHLKQHPNSAKGWFLLGRLYASQNQWQPAEAAFFKAHQLKPDDEQITVNYVQSRLVENQQKFDEKSRVLLTSVLEKNPNQPDALALLAMDDYANKRYQQAIHRWERLLKLAPAGSEEAQAIRKAIAKAQSKLNKE